MRTFTILFLIGLLAACGTPSAVQPTIAPPAPSPAATIPPAPSPEVLAQLATDAPTEAPPTVQPTDVAEPTAVAPTIAPAPAPGAAPQGSDCPADHPVKGNIVDRGANKGDKIYHLPSSSSYKATKPERCFVDAKEAEAAGFRAPK